MNTEILITCILSSTLAATVITSIKEVILWIMNRKAKIIDDNKKDKSESYEQKLDKMIASSEAAQKKLEDCIKGNRATLQDRIKFIAISHLKNKEIAYEDRKILHEMWEIYHYSLGGNGDLNDIMDLIDALPIKYE